MKRAMFLVVAVGAACGLAACGGGNSSGATVTSSDDLKGVVVFVDLRNGNQQIYIKKLPDGDETNLTNSRFEDFDPDVSRDGSKIVFASNRSGSMSSKNRG